MASNKKNKPGQLRAWDEATLNRRAALNPTSDFPAAIQRTSVKMRAILTAETDSDERQPPKIDKE